MVFETVFRRGIRLVHSPAGQSNTFYAFGVIGIAALAFVATVVPETKGKSLEEIEALFMEPGSAR